MLDGYGKEASMQAERQDWRSPGAGDGRDAARPARSVMPRPGPEEVRAVPDKQIQRWEDDGGAWVRTTRQVRLGASSGGPLPNPNG